MVYMKLSNDQTVVLKKIKKWIKTKEQFFILKGFAGTGKSFLMRLIAEDNIKNLYFSATTNKACKVLQDSIGQPVKTIYSLLGLRMEQSEDRLVLNIPEKPSYFPRNSIVVVDESSMIGMDLLKAIFSCSKHYNVRFLFVGDPAQIPPVGEIMSPVWRLDIDDEYVGFLQQVMRNDNELLNLATNIRTCLKEKKYISPFEHDVSDFDEGVFMLPSQQDFENKILQYKDFTKVKVIAWRNKTVDYYNNIVRKSLGFNDRFNVGDVLLIGEPVEREDVFIAHKDDEYIVTGVTENNVVTFDDCDIEFWGLYTRGTEQDLFLRIPKNANEVESLLIYKANYAKKCPKFEKKQAWKEFWYIKKYFDCVRYGYALTSHRAQGSTLEECFIDQQDILCNQKSQEAFQCLYVAATRATKKIYSY